VYGPENLAIRHLIRALITGALGLILCGPSALPTTQEDSVAPAEAPYEFVSGTVVDLSGGKIVVNRAVPGKPSENHTFTINADTKVEGNLRVNARVTVGYKAVPDTGEFIAVRIIVRAQQGRK
jgi:hypothetical protein